MFTNTDAQPPSTPPVSHISTNRGLQSWSWVKMELLHNTGNNLLNIEVFSSCHPTTSHLKKIPNTASHVDFLHSRQWRVTENRDAGAQHWNWGPKTISHNLPSAQFFLHPKSLCLPIQYLMVKSKPHIWVSCVIPIRSKPPAYLTPVGNCLDIRFRIRYGRARASRSARTGC